MSKHKHEKPSIRQVFDLESELFDSRIYYPGEWIIGDDFNQSRHSCYDDIKASTLYLNAKGNKDNNAFEKFLQKYFIPTIRSIYGTDGRKISEEVYPYITMLENDTNRYLGFGKASILSALILKSLPDTLRKVFDEIKSSDLDDDNALGVLRTCLIEDRKYIKEIRDNENSTHRHIINVARPDGKPVTEARRKEIISELIEDINIRLRGTRNLDSILGRKINYQEFMDCFSYDKLCLIIGLSAFLDTQSHLEKEGQCPASMMYLHDYVHSVMHLRKTVPNYHETIKICVRDDNGRLIYQDFTADDLIKEYKRIISEYPEIKESEINLTELFKRFNVSEEYVKSLDPVAYTALLQELVEKNKALDSLTVNWEILPTKEGVKDPSNSIDPRPYNPTVEITNIEERSNAFNAYIASLPSLLQLKGINDFDGYIAYVMGNSKVILEKPKGTKKSEYYGATYIMDLDAFFELSKLSRTEIIDGLSDGTITGVKRIYHTYDEKSDDPIAKYKARIARYLEDSEYNKDMIDSIYAIIENARAKEHENEPKRVRTNQN